MEYPACAAPHGAYRYPSQPKIPQGRPKIPPRPRIPKKARIPRRPRRLRIPEPTKKTGISPAEK